MAAFRDATAGAEQVDDAAGAALGLLDTGLVAFADVEKNARRGARMILDCWQLDF